MQGAEAIVDVEYRCEDRGKRSGRGFGILWHGICFWGLLHLCFWCSGARLCVSSCMALCFQSVSSLCVRFPEDVCPRARLSTPVCPFLLNALVALSQLRAVYAMPS